ncbi:MAG: thioredoxin family protein [Marinifilaceae bacterium]|jgi:thioredoxin-related protein|nr:thioredoxin family protein [Marinifilaceae bacterium]
MKKLFRITVLLITLSLSANCYAQTKNVNFQHAKWKKILSMAKKQNKLIFIDCYTAWCGPCKMLAKKVFTQDKVADYMNQNFINFKCDMEKGEGPKLKEKFKVTAFPTLLLVNSKQEVVHRIVGAYEAEEFLTYLKEGTTKDLNTLALQKKYDNGERTGEFMFQYLRSLRLANQNALESKLSKEFICNLPKENLLNKENWNLIKYFLNDPLTDAFRYIVKHRTKLAKIVGEKELEQKIYKTYDKRIMKFAYFYPQEGSKFDTESFLNLKSDLMKGDFIHSSELLTRMIKTEYARQNKWDEMAYTVQAAMDLNTLKYYAGKFSFFNQAASEMAKASKKPNLLKMALAWATYAADNEDRVEHKSGYLKTKADILQLVGKADEAKKANQESANADKEAEKKGTKIHSIPMIKMGGK